MVWCWYQCRWGVVRQRVGGSGEGVEAMEEVVVAVDVVKEEVEEGRGG